MRIYNVLDLLSKIILILVLLAIISLAVCGIVYSISRGDVFTDYDMAQMNIGGQYYRVKITKVVWRDDGSVVLTDTNGEIYLTTKDNVILIDTED